MMKREHAMLQLHRFIKNCRFRIADAGEPGWSWLELFVLFELRGGRVDNDAEKKYKRLQAGQSEADVDAPNAKAKQPVEELLKAFKEQVRYVAENTQVETDRGM